jgi:hypothetical protein
MNLGLRNNKISEGLIRRSKKLTLVIFIKIINRETTETVYERVVEIVPPSIPRNGI